MSRRGADPGGDLAGLVVDIVVLLVKALFWLALHLGRWAAPRVWAAALVLTSAMVLWVEPRVRRWLGLRDNSLLFSAPGLAVLGGVTWSCAGLLLALGVGFAMIVASPSPATPTGVALLSSGLFLGTTAVGVCAGVSLHTKLDFDRHQAGYYLTDDEWTVGGDA